MVTDMRLKTAVRRHGDKIQLPVVIAREGKWLVAKVPVLGLATQGKTLKEVKENVADLLNLYFENPHTPKPQLKALSNTDIMLTTITITLPKGASDNAKARAIAAT